jgi:hypothetical protein
MEFDLPSSLQILEHTPSVFHTLLAGLPNDWTASNEGGESWSAYDIIGHLAHGERTDWIPRAELILAQGDHRRFTPYDRFAQFEESKGKTLDDLLREFSEERARNVKILRSWNLTEAQLSLEGEHPAFGAVTLRQLLSTWVVHDLGHIAQTSRVMAKQYTDAIGPWREYLPVVTR